MIGEDTIAALVEIAGDLSSSDRLRALLTVLAAEEEGREVTSEEAWPEGMNRQMRFYMMKKHMGRYMHVERRRREHGLLVVHSATLRSRLLKLVEALVDVATELASVAGSRRAEITITKTVPLTHFLKELGFKAKDIVGGSRIGKIEVLPSKSEPGMFVVKASGEAIEVAAADLKDTLEQLQEPGEN